MEPDAEPPSPLSDAPSDFDILDNEERLEAFKRGGPVQSTMEETAELNLDNSSPLSAPQELTHSRTSSDFMDTVALIEQSKNVVREGDGDASPAESQGPLAELENENQAGVKSHASDVDEHMEAHGRSTRKRKVPKQYEEHLETIPPHPTKTRRQAITNDTHPPTDDHHDQPSDQPSLEAKISNQEAQCKAEPASLQELGMEAENAVELQVPRSRRQRNAPQNYDEPASDAEFEVDAPDKGKRTSSSGGKPKRVAVTWTPDHLLQDPKSRLGKVNLTAILKDPRAWESLSKEQQSQLISLLPNVPGLDSDSVDGDFLYNILQEFLNNSALLSDIAMFGEDLREGRLDPGWQHDGQVAMEMRARGDFDDWKVQEMESFWGQKQKLNYDVLAGESSKIKLEELVREGTIHVGDVWVYRRAFGKAKDSIVVEKEAKVISITRDFKLVFSFPPGTAKFSSPNAGKDIVTEPLSGPQQLGDAMIKEDGRITSYRNNNAWKEYRVFRNQNDIGNLWERRELHWAKKTEGRASK